MALDLGTILGAALGGGGLAAVIGYLANRRKTNSDINVATFGTLRDMNELLKAQLADVQTQLDAERTARRGLEDELAAERRARRSLEERVALLEKTIPPPGGEDLA
jgi:hypothetical protein